MFLARTPHGYHDTEQIDVELRKAGFSAIKIVTLHETSDAPSARHPAVAYCQGTPLRNEIEARDPEAVQSVTDSSAAAIARAHGHGPVSGKIRGHVIVARA
jgi:hypothetical protein